MGEVDEGRRWGVYHGVTGAVRRWDGDQDYEAEMGSPREDGEEMEEGVRCKTSARLAVSPGMTHREAQISSHGLTVSNRDGQRICNE